MSKVKANKKYYHRKLVRDRIPEIIESKGGSYKAKLLNTKEFRRFLRKKLAEEAKELVGARKNELVNELADVLQLIKSIAELESIPFKSIESKRKKKEKKVGAFKKQIFLVWSDKPAGGK